MNALMMTNYGNPNTSLAFQNVLQPSIGINQVLIKTCAASINPIDYKILRGDFKAITKVVFPAGIGRDVSGIVAKVGLNVKNVQVGDEVFSRVKEPFVGTLAEYVISDVEDVAKKPTELTHEESASIPLAGLTAYQSLIDIAKLTSGEKVLIHAGSGGVGSIAIQLAKSVGAFVATTTSTGNVAMVQALGADQVIDYKKQNYLNEIKDFDVVFDTLGGDYTIDAFDVIKTGGRVVSVAGPMDAKTAKERGMNIFIRGFLALKARGVMKAANQKKALYRLVLMVSNGEQLTTLANLCRSGELKPIIDSVYSFKDSINALNYLIEGRAKGKVVIKFNGEST